jgi:thioredoxin reductase
MNGRNRLIFAGIFALAVLTAFLSFHRSYSPGPLLEGHQPFGANCAACHKAWSGVELSSSSCIDCHGNIVHNDHLDAKLDDKDSGLVAAEHISGFDDRLACLSCHTDHKGRNVDLAATSETNCTYCHAHDSIADVGAHSHSLRVRWKPLQNFLKDFSHKQHLEDAIKHLQEARKDAQRMRSASRKQEAEKAAAELAGVLDHSEQHLNCRSCHLISAPSDDKPEEFAIVTTGCTVSTCHSNWQDEDLRLATAGAVPQSQAVSAPPEPFTIPFVQSVIFRPVNAMFVPHSSGHLRAECTGCHLHMEESGKPRDSHTNEIAKCFNCHTHQAGTSAGQVAMSTDSGGVVSVRRAEAADVEVLELPEEKILNACADCHAFHSYYRGATLVKDFPSKAPTVRPHQPAALELAAYTISAHRTLDGYANIALQRVTVRPWWVAILALLAMTLVGAAYVRTLPAQTHRQLISNAGAQRTPEIPALDDTYQSSVPRVYVAGEAGGTASINFAMRSGRQVIEAIASVLRHEKRAVEPEVYDVAIIGCGPTGISATWFAKSKGLSYLAVEKTTAASTIRTYPRGKFVQATPIELEEYGSFYMQGDNTKEELVKKWEEMLQTMQLQINEREEVISVRQADDLFEIATQPGKRFKARFVVLAIGVRGTPRKLNVEGEMADRVFYNLIEPEEFKDKRILVVGGGNAGAEVTQALADPALRNTVSYSFRDPALGPPVTPENAEKISDLQQRARITVYPWSQVKEIRPGKVILAPRAESSRKPAQQTADPSAPAQKSRGFLALLTALFGRAKRGEHAAEKSAAAQQASDPSLVKLNEPIEIENDFVFAMLGAELPTAFMKSIGIRMTRKGF